MLTYFIEDRILFTCDLFGSHLAASEIYSSDSYEIYEAAKRYYAEIMMPFRNIIKHHLLKIEKLEPAIIAPSHGPIYKNPSFIIDAYKEWVSDNVKNSVLILYVSMHGSSLKISEILTDELIKRGISAKKFDLTTADIGKIAINLVDAATVIIATPAVIGSAHPRAIYITYLFNLLRPKTRYFSILASYGWGSKTVESLSSLLTFVKPEILEPLLINGIPKDQDTKKICELADIILKNHKNDALVLWE